MKVRRMGSLVIINAVARFSGFKFTSGKAAVESEIDWRPDASFSRRNMQGSIRCSS